MGLDRHLSVLGVRGNLSLKEGGRGHRVLGSSKVLGIYRVELDQ